MKQAAVPVVAHRLEDGIVKLDGPGNEQSRMRSLGRHCGYLAPLDV